MLKKLIFSLLLIGAFFYIFHDYVYYAIDSHHIIFQENNCSKNDSCKFHENLHIPAMTSITQNSFVIEFTDNYNFIYTKLQLEPFSKEIFKPPKHIAG